jgi:hypothetical protein
MEATVRVCSLAPLPRLAQLDFEVLYPLLCQDPLGFDPPKGFGRLVLRRPLFVG